jgi:hypothetical protein
LDIRLRCFVWNAIHKSVTGIGFRLHWKARDYEGSTGGPADGVSGVTDTISVFAFVLNQVQARSPRLYGAADSLAKRAIELKMASTFAQTAAVASLPDQSARQLNGGLGCL